LGIVKVPGDWRETMSSHWFHDHMFEHTAENVYKGSAGFHNLYSCWT
jgi:predicted transposase YbfD/YdcC